MQYIQSVLLNPYMNVPVKLLLRIIGFSDSSTSVPVEWSPDSVRSCSSKSANSDLNSIVIGHQFSHILAFVFQNSSQLLYSDYHTYANPHSLSHRKQYSPGDNMVLHLLSTDTAVFTL